MSVKDSQSKSTRRDDMEARIALLEYQFSEVQKSLNRIEQKQDASIRQIDTLKYVDQHEFDSYQKMVSNTYVSAESLKPMKTLFWAIITASVLGLISLGFFIIESLVKR